MVPVVSRSCFKLILWMIKLKTIDRKNYFLKFFYSKTKRLILKSKKNRMSTSQNSIQNPSQIRMQFVIFLYRQWQLQNVWLVKHLYKHKFPSWPWVQYTWSLRCLGFKTGHFALRREENIVELVEPPFRNQKLSLVHTKNNWTFIWTFPFHLCLLTVYVLPRNVVWKPTAAWWDSRIPRRLYSQAKSSVPPRFH